TSRGIRRNAQVVQCRAGCQANETAAHIIQGCFRTHGGRILRHNAVCRILASGLRKSGWQVEEEPVYNTPAGRRKPDLVCVRGGEAKVIDAQVVARSRGIDQAKVSFTSCTISWRGVWAGLSVEALLAMGLTKRLLQGITTRVLQGSHTNWTRWNQMTIRRPQETGATERQGVG
ncbi:hypothetical protein KM043_000053, partial [Ampulex compressa]